MVVIYLSDLHCQRKSGKIFPYKLKRIYASLQTFIRFNGCWALQKWSISFIRCLKVESNILIWQISRIQERHETDIIFIWTGNIQSTISDFPLLNASKAHIKGTVAIINIKPFSSPIPRKRVICQWWWTEESDVRQVQTFQFVI